MKSQEKGEETDTKEIKIIVFLAPFVCQWDIQINVFHK